MKPKPISIPSASSIERPNALSYTDLLIKHIDRWSTIESHQQSKTKINEITDLINQININIAHGNVYPDYNQLFTTFLKEKFDKENKEFHTKCSTLLNKFLHRAHTTDISTTADAASETSEQGEREEATIAQTPSQSKFPPQLASRCEEPPANTECEVQLQSHSQSPSEIPTDDDNIPKRPERVLIMIDWDDTIIPSTVIKKKKFDVSERNTKDKEKKSLDQYVEIVSLFLGKLLQIFNGNKDNSIKIVTNASSLWVSQGSFCRTGELFMRKMRKFNEELADAKINIISAHDHSSKHQDTFSRLEVREYKEYLMRLIYYDHFGKQIRNKDEDIKIISIGDSSMEFNASRLALDQYLYEQEPEDLRQINVTLHRVKFRKKPQSFEALSDQLKWCIDNIEDIVYNNNSSKNYFL